MPAQKLTPQDAQSISKTATLNGTKYQYLLSLPSTPPKGTIFLVHGWPDLSFGWRCQIPFLTSLGLRVVVPDMTGYGGTDAPVEVGMYSFKKTSDDLAALAKELGCERIILGGHDWGGMVVYRFAQWYPQLVTHVFSVCTPFAPRSSKYFSTEELVKGPVPQFGYQLQLASGDIQKAVQTRDDLQQFLRGIYAGKVTKGKPFMDPRRGVDLSLLGSVERNKSMSEEEEKYVVDQYARNGIGGTLNWYKTRKVNFDDELKLPKGKFQHPVLFILANKDNVLSKDFAAGMAKMVPNLVQKEVTAGHWALWQAADEVNAHVKQWLEEVVFPTKSHL